MTLEIHGLKHIRRYMASSYKVETYKGGPLQGGWRPLIKIDGVHVHLKEGKPLSKHGKPLYNLDRLAEHAELMGLDGDSHWEYFHTDWNRSVSEVRKQHGGVPVDMKHCFLLPDKDDTCFNNYDPRLDFGYDHGLGLYETFPESLIEKMMESSVARGNEGLVFIPEIGNPSNKIYRVKPFLSYDLPITGYYEGNGKFAGMLGGVTTSMGKVGVFTGDESIRETLWAERETLVGRMIEVKCFELTKTGKFRHPRFMRFRPDKEE